MPRRFVAVEILGAGATAHNVQAIELESSYAKGHARKGAALVGLCRYLDAFKAYEAGLEVDPNSDLCRQGVAKVKEAMQINGFSTCPDLFAVLEANRETRAYLEDPALVQLVRQLQTSQGMSSEWMDDQRMLKVMLKVMSVTMEGGVVS
jgi:stress-induced-phosphoprotein 1